MHCNGIDTDQFFGWTEVIDDNPGAGLVVATVRHRWDSGFAVDGLCESVAQAGELHSRTEHAARTDWPEPFGANSGPTPGAESLLAALGACVATTYVAKAAAAGVAIDELEVITQGRVDLRGLLELHDVPAAFSDVSVTVHVRSGANATVLEQLGATVTRTSPVYRSLVVPVPVELRVQQQT